MAARRLMAFIDGENLTMRYQNMVQQGRTPLKNNVYVPDVFVWNPGAVNIEAHCEILRATYYTYAVGDDAHIKQWTDELKAIDYQYRISTQELVQTGFIYPKIFKKPQRTAKRKGVDISIAVDSLCHVYGNSVDIVYLVTGDGDYKPLIDEIVRNGKRVYLGALSDGLNPVLPNIVDRFFDLDDKFFTKIIQHP